MGRLIRESCAETHQGNTTTHNHTLVYLYDESGVIGLMYGYDGETPQPYYYQRNAQGDVISIHSANGTKVAEYAYDAYGNCTIVSGATSNLANYNPIRYRGYYYDRETGLYYLNARYYNPEWRRFISSDKTAYIDPETPNGLNLYAYCNNEPVNFVDPSGNSATKWWEWVLSGAIVTVLIIGAVATAGTLPGAVLAGAAIGGGLSLGTQALGGELNLGQFALDIGVGAITGLIGGSGVSRRVSTILGGVVGAVSNFASQLITGTALADISIMQIVASGMIGSASGFLGGAGARNQSAIDKDKGVKAAMKTLQKVMRRIESGTRYKSATAAQTAFTNAMNGLTMAIQYRMSSMFTAAMIYYGVSTALFSGIDAVCDANEWWAF